jgi:polyhydroxyalkanoate synthase
VVSPPGRSRRDYWVDGDAGADAEGWLATAQRVHGSWWPHWSAWLAAHGGPRVAAPARAGGDRHPPLGPAPGRYVREVPD